MNRVFVAGSINNDVVVGAERHPQPGETVRGTSLEYYAGGKGLNQAVAAARAGAEAFMVGAVGDDEAGRQLREFLSGSGVSTRFVKQVGDRPTGTALITVANGENTIAVVAGANAELSEGDVRLDYEPGDVVLAQFETPVPATVEAFRTAKAAGATTMLNPTPVEAISQDLLGLTDYLVVNEHEFSHIFGAEIPKDHKRARRFSRFASRIVLTLGKNGALLFSSDDYLRVPGVKVKEVDSTGAGDCFTGYLAAGVAVNNDIEKTLKLANAAAALSVTRPGAAPSIPDVTEVKAFMR